MVEPDWAALEDLDDTQLRGGPLHDIGAGRTEQVLTEAAAVVAADRAAWDKGRSDLDALGEWAVTQPYRGLRPAPGWPSLHP